MEKVMAEIFLSEDVFLSPPVIELQTCRWARVVLAKLGDKTIKIGYVYLPTDFNQVRSMARLPVPCE